MKRITILCFLVLLSSLGLVQAQSFRERVQVGGHFSLDAHSWFSYPRSFDPFYHTPVAYSLGLHTNFMVTPRFSILTGLGYSQAVVRGGLVTDTPEFGIQPATLERVIRDLEVPLLLYLRPFGKPSAKFSVSFSGGVVMGFALQQFATISGPPNTFPDERFDIVFGATPERLKLQLGIGLNWRVSDKTQLLLEPVLRYDFVDDLKNLTSYFAATNRALRNSGIRLLVNYQL